MQIFKQEKILELWVEREEKKGYELFKRYPIKKTSGKLGPKQKEGDRQNPEGFYTINKKRLNPYSRFLLSMNIGYPNRLDRNLKRTGYAIMIHGGCQSIGCFAMGDDAIEEIYTIAYNALESGQPFFYVAIYPFKMTEQNLQHYHDSHWYNFWLNLKEGYELFLKEHYPPKVIVKGDRYLFKPTS
jgi:murein L,D-transpeptidase YafK